MFEEGFEEVPLPSVPEVPPEPQTEAFDGRETWRNEIEEGLDQEEAMYGDLIRLDGLWGGDNMNMGKTWHWDSVDWAGRRETGEMGPVSATAACRVDLPGSATMMWAANTRTALTGQTLPILSNLIPILLKHDPAKPTYVGSTMGAWVVGYHHYFQGMMYGWSWGVVRWRFRL